MKKKRTLSLFASVTATLLSLGAAVGATAKDETAKTIERIEVFPAALSLDGPSDARRVLVTGWTASGERVDLSAEVKFEIPQAPGSSSPGSSSPGSSSPGSSSIVRQDADGYFAGVEDGVAAVKVAAAGREAVLPITVRAMKAACPVSFVRDVEPVLSKVGCTAGTCHGAAKGKNGFQLSLRGYNPEFDYRSLVDDISGRRFNRADPGQSLMLLKPTQGSPHEGGFLFDNDSRFYKTLFRWIEEGLESDAEKTVRVARIEVLPKDVTFQDGGEAQQVLVIAHYPEGTTRDVTRDAFFTSSAFTVAEVSPAGRVSSIRRGETAVIVRYEGQFATATVTVLGDRSGYAWTEVPENNYIDGLIDQKLKKIKALPSRLTTDEEFTRRVFIDTIGVPPTPEEARACLAGAKEGESYSEKTARRRRLIDQLIDRPEFVDHWALKWGDLLQANRKYLGPKGVWAFRNWIRQAVAQNIPFDRLAREILTATGSNYDNPPTSFMRIAREPNVAMETTTQLFLGVRFMCNKCHDHPFEQWTQNQYYQLSAFFAGTGIKPGAAPGDEVIYERRDGGQVIHPKTGRAALASFPFTYGVEVPKDEPPREQLADWITNPANPYFARAVVNRMWSYFFGRGIIEPVDDVRASNPPSNPELLAAMTDDFIKHSFDLRYIIRTIVSSRTYQIAAEATEWNVDDTANFSHQKPRRLTAEQLLDSISVAAGSSLHFNGVPEGFYAKQLPDTKVEDNGFLDLFGRPPRESPCECERRSEISLAQAMNLINGPTIANAVTDPKGRIAQAVDAGKTDDQVVEELYLATLGRFPVEADYKVAREYLSGSEERNQKFQDLLWALINSPAFLFNH